MPLLPHDNKHSHENPSGSPKKPVAFLSWVKELLRWTHKKRATIHAAGLKRDINRLEKEREKEHSALLRQRKFYETLIKRPVEKLPIEKPKVIEPVINEKIIEKPVIEKAVIEEPIIEKPIIEEPRKEPVIEEPKAVFVETPSMPIPEATIEYAEEIVPSIKKESTVEKSSPDFFAALKKKFSFKLSKSSLVGKLAQERKEEEAAQHKNEVEERFWQPYNGVKANLIKDQGVLFFNWKQRILTLSLALVLCSLAIGLVYVGLLVWQKERLNDNQATLANFAAINDEVAKNEKEIQEVVVFNRKLDIVNFILSNHIYWTNYFSFLEANTLKDVYFDGFSGDLTGKYTIPAYSKNLDAISLQLEVMKAYNMMRTIQYSAAQTVAGAGGVPERVKFNLEMSVDPKIFLK